MSRSDETAVAAYRERFAQIMVDSGMPRMAARVYIAVLISDAGRYSAAELAALLGAGASAISGAVKYLIQVGLIERGREPGTRRDHYRIHDGTWAEFVSQTDPLLSRVETVAAEGEHVLGADTAAGRRLADTSRFFDFMREEIKRSMDKWHRRQQNRTT
ncbi:MAG TPA: MarR family transcriptional regulator [Stackebrandtia sp.]|uniref:GbsR/MarR family transcriptional regulator n=1 Tax=Stackebrandtia sp. TaxID=2023065 RepID=UPI002D3EF6AC|nr:MarR family transcriptional regulator [Stackebrandtia sp.]HZE38389.1 MarR family transcriptional regulator [Stackebrandtia sp.]